MATKKPKKKAASTASTSGATSPASPSPAAPAGSSAAPAPAPKPKKATPKKAKGGAEQRQHPRVALDVLVQVRSASVAEFRALHAKNISVGGMFIAGGAAKPLGAEVFFQFTVKDGGTLIEGLGKVVHSSTTGLGVEFVNVLEPSSSIIRALVEERLKQPA